MKTTDPQDDALSELLRMRRTTATLPPRFREGVWRQIAQEEKKSDLTLLARIGAWLENVLPRPKIALCYLTALLLLGTVSGLWSAQRESRRLNAELGSRYVQSIDPYYTVPPNR